MGVFVSDSSCDKRNVKLLAFLRGAGAKEVVISLADLLSQLRVLQNPSFYTVVNSVMSIWLNFLKLTWRIRLMVEMLFK